MFLIKHYSILEYELAHKPFEEGALYVTSDTHRLFVDIAGEGSHTLISASPIIISTEEERENLLAPINNSLYFVLESSKLYLYNSRNWCILTYTHPTTSGNNHIPAGGSSGQILRWNSDGTAVWDNENDTTYDIATDSKNGLMSSSMVTKLEGIDPGANKTIVDESLSSTSTNPVQNKVINNALANKQPLGDYALKSELGNFLPEVTSSNNGQILRVIDGVWAATLLPNAEDGKF